MISRKFMYVFAFCFILYSAFQHNYEVTGSYIPKAPLPAKVKLPDNLADQSFMIKVLKFFTYEVNDNVACDVVKEEMPAYKVFVMSAAGANLHCTEHLDFDYKLYQLDGILLYESKSSKRHHFTLAAYNLPYAIQKALVYAQHHSKLTIITPTKYLLHNGKMSALTEFYPNNIAIAKDQMMLLDLNIN